MKNLFEVEILDEEKVVYKGHVESLIVPAALGYLGILANHIPIIALLKEGHIIAREPAGEARTFYLKEQEGFLEFLKNRATIVLYPRSAL